MPYALDMPLVLLFVGLIYIIETLSDILQVSYFKLTHGKRIFKMAPIHHHFEMCGWSGEKNLGGLRLRYRCHVRDRLVRRAHLVLI